MDYNKINAHITTVDIKQSDLDIERINEENNELMKIITNSEFKGMVHDSLSDKVTTI